MKKLLIVLSLASAPLISVTPAHAIMQCTGSGDEIDCEDDGNIDMNDPDLTTAERNQLARITDALDKRAEQREQREKQQRVRDEERERVRRSQCTVPLLWIGCPPKKEARK